MAGSGMKIGGDIAISQPLEIINLYISHTRLNHKTELRGLIEPLSRNPEERSHPGCSGLLQREDKQNAGNTSCDVVLRLKEGLRE